MENCPSHQYLSCFLPDFSFFGLLQWHLSTQHFVRIKNISAVTGLIWIKLWTKGPGNINNWLQLSPQHLSRQHLSISAIAQLFLARFGSNFKQRVLGTYTTDYNCHHDICPGNINIGSSIIWKYFDIDSFNRNKNKIMWTFIMWTMHQVVFHRRSSTIRGCFLLKFVFFWRLSSIEGGILSRVFLYRRSSSIKGSLQSKYIFDQRSSSKVAFHEKFSFIKGHMIEEQTDFIFRQIKQRIFSWKEINYVLNKLQILIWIDTKK